ncbi:hypothetical protein RND71_014283 [Anisodus tanguticus]|uniref:E2F transcription factor CC-MB domain-containing protein n=1 Tax=Anisodus tanguticus TaxID=243964 RepID=A0AAE1S9H7_9SOLA|nr:hypothetical protein RND71_014283 [Anisodus tanguticus]
MLLILTCPSSPEGCSRYINYTRLLAEVENLTIKVYRLDDQIREMQERWIFVTEDDLKSLPCFQNETLIAIKAPRDTTLEVPDPDEAVDYPQRRYRIVRKSKTSQDFVTGIMKKIVPDVDNEADYWLLSDADVSITDMWMTECILLNSVFCSS